MQIGIMRTLITIIIGVILIIGCNPQMPVRNFNIELRHFYSAEGYTLYYNVNQDSLRIKYNCDF